MFTLSWLKDMLERAIKTLAQSFLGILTTNGVDITSLDVKQTASVVLSATVISVLTSVISAGVGSTGTASLTSAIEAAPPPAELSTRGGVEAP